MHDMDWNDLRYILALEGEKSFAAAGRYLGTDPTTVSRRLRAVERSLGATLFHRGETGSMTLTAAGEIAVARARAIETEVGGLSAALRNADSSVSGSVRVTAAPFLINRLLIPATPDIVSRHPELRLELIADSRNLSLTRREADIALRLARPTEMAGNRIIARRIATLGYGVYVARQTAGAFEQLPWIVYDDSMVHLPHAQWIAAEASKLGARSSVVINEAEGLIQAACAGLGRALLPTLVGDRIDGLVRLVEAQKTPPTRELWLLTHPDIRHLARIKAISAWIEATFAVA